ncbi:MAG: PIN domain nuclease [Clostridia bacterium]
MKKLPRPFLILSRMIFTPLGVVCGILIGELIAKHITAFQSQYILLNIFILLSGGAIGVVSYFFGPLLCQIIYNTGGRLVTTLKLYSGQEIIAGGLGLLAGMFLASLINNLFTLISVSWIAALLSAFSYLFFAFVGMIIGVSYLKGVIVPTDMVDSNVPKILDSSALIDGRILDVAKTGFVEGPFVIPAFVVAQLQAVADSEDLLKRSRGRRGLDIINELQEQLGIGVVIDDSNFTDTIDIDGKVLKLAMKIKGVIITVDFNLNKVAAVKKIKVLNLNELSNAIKPKAIPGEKITLTVLKEGKEVGQGVSYLEDGTMVVIENGGDYVGKTAVVTITTSLQTNAGRIIFGRIMLD